jgi:hypothetical protein
MVPFSAPSPRAGGTIPGILYAKSSHLGAEVLQAMMLRQDAAYRLRAVRIVRLRPANKTSGTPERLGLKFPMVTSGLWREYSYTRARRVRRAKKASPQRAMPVSAQADGSGTTWAPLTVKLRT